MWRFGRINNETLWVSEAPGWSKKHCCKIDFLWWYSSLCCSPWWCSTQWCSPWRTVCSVSSSAAPRKKDKEKNWSQQTGKRSKLPQEVESARLFLYTALVLCFQFSLLSMMMARYLPSSPWGGEQASSIKAHCLGAKAAPASCLWAPCFHSVVLTCSTTTFMPSCVFYSPGKEL